MYRGNGEVTKNDLVLSRPGNGAVTDDITQRKNMDDYTSLEEQLIDMIVDFLCENHSERELREIVERAIRYSNGE